MTYKKKQVGNQPYYAEFIKGENKTASGKALPKTAASKTGYKPKNGKKKEKEFRPIKNTMYGKPEKFRALTTNKRNSDSRPTRDAGDRPTFQRREDSNDRPRPERREWAAKPPRRDAGDRPTFQRREDSNDRPRPERREWSAKPPRRDAGNRPTFQRREDSNDRPRTERREWAAKPPRRDAGDRPTFQRREDSNDRPRPERRDESERPMRNHRFGERKYKEENDNNTEGLPRTNNEERLTSEQPALKAKDSEESAKSEKQERSTEDRRSGRHRSAPSYDLERAGERYDKRPRREVQKKNDEELMRLNRYIANAGVCSRREADTIIESGQISVNNKTITELGYKVKLTDIVKYGNRILNPEKIVYLLLNKPKGYITTTDDPDERDTVMDLIAGACKERIYPVGRLDRNTTGLLMFTNDGELAEKLMHPSNQIQKVYQVELDRPISEADFEAIKAGIELEDGPIKVDDLAIVTPDAEVVGVEIHSGRNRIVRRIFEHFDYEVKKLDRTAYAGLNKKELPRGNWRFLTEREVIKLKYLL